MEALNKTGSMMNPGMTSNGVLVWEEGSDHSKDLFPESYALIRTLQATIEQETEQLKEALNLERVLKVLYRKTACDYDKFGIPVTIDEIVKETGIFFDTAVKIVNDLNASRNQKEVFTVKSCMRLHKQ